MKHTVLFILSVFVLAFTACTSTRDIVYMQDIDEVELQKIVSRYEAKIKKDDLLNIVVSGPDKQVVMPYNLTLSDNANGGSINPEHTSLPYLVDPKGDINFPIFGKIHVEGMTRSQLAQALTDSISRDVKDPIVYISFRNYKITVLGEVSNPGTYTVSSEKTSLYEALGLAGDLTLTAKRDDIILLREVNGVNKYYKIDLTSAEVMNKDYFYMQQNDVLYIPPSEKRIRAATTNTNLWSFAFSTITTAISIITMIIALTK